MNSCTPTEQAQRPADARPQSNLLKKVLKRRLQSITDNDRDGSLSPLPKRNTAPLLSESNAINSSFLQDYELCEVHQTQTVDSTAAILNQDRELWNLSRQLLLQQRAKPNCRIPNKKPNLNYPCCIKGGAPPSGFSHPMFVLEGSILSEETSSVLEKPLGIMIMNQSGNIENLCEI